jgi:hypothetical protein
MMMAMMTMTMTMMMIVDGMQAEELLRMIFITYLL